MEILVFEDLFKSPYRHPQCFYACVRKWNFGDGMKIMCFLIRLRELSVEIKSPGDFFFDVFGTKKALFPKICPNIIPLIDLLEGEWGTPGCTILVHYHLDGAAMISRETIVAVDKENKSITYKLLEGDIMKIFKTVTMTVQPTQKSECNFFKWTIIYEKFLDEDIQAFFDAWKEFMNNVTKEIDAYYFQAQPQGYN
ncbi:hypothetical protein LguiB_026277 [Lonicera macranthoides]